MRKTKTIKVVTSIYIEEPRFLRFEIREEDVFIILCGESSVIKKDKWPQFVHTVAHEKNLEFTLDNNIIVNTKHKGMVYVKRYGSFSGCTIEEWKSMTDKVTHLLK